MRVIDEYKSLANQKEFFMKAYILMIVLLTTSLVANAGPSVSGSPMNGPKVVCSKNFERGLWIYQVGFQTDKFEGYYVNNGTSSAALDCKFVNDVESKLMWDCSATSAVVNGSSAQIIVNAKGNLEMQFFAHDQIENPAPTDVVVCD